MKIETSIAESYLSSTTHRAGWGLWEGVREIVQNGKDAEAQYAAPLTVDVRGTTLRVANQGATLAREALLLGTSSKRDRPDLIGHFGEGLKLGILALVRDGHAVTIRTGSEVWTASIERSERYAANVLTFAIKTGNAHKDRVRVEIEGINTDTWEAIKSRFLFLTRPKADEQVVTERGTLLLGDRFRGCVYVKGVYVQTDSKLAMGYDFRDVALDRDRRMVDSFDLRWASAQILQHAVAQRPDLLNPYYDLLADNATDVAGTEHAAAYAPAEVAAKVAETFRAKFGADAVPVASLAESAEVEHLGRRGVVVGKPLGAMLARVVGNADTVKQALRHEVVKTYSWGDLSPDQRATLTEALALVQAVRPGCTLDVVDLVDFRSPSLLGQHKDGRCLLAARLLDDPDELLATLVHEYAHAAGGDGEKGHVAEIEAIWRDIVRHLRKRSAS